MVEDQTAASGKALAQLSQDSSDYRYPLAIYRPVILADVEVTTRFKAVAGKEDQAAGIAFRLQDADNYYVVRANALEDNVRLYHVVKGDRRQIAGTDVKVLPGQWHSLAVRARAQRIEVELDGNRLFEKSDTTFALPGRIALWTKSDSVTYFQGLHIRSLH